MARMPNLQSRIHGDHTDIETMCVRTICETVGSETVGESCVRTVCTYECVRTYVYIRCWDITYGRCIYGTGTYIVYLTT
jgi:hypothetical protein